MGKRTLKAGDVKPGDTLFYYGVADMPTYSATEVTVSKEGARWVLTLVNGKDKGKMLDTFGVSRLAWYETVAERAERQKRERLDKERATVGSASSKPVKAATHEFSAHSRRPWECRLCGIGKDEHGAPAPVEADAPVMALPVIGQPVSWQGIAYYVESRYSDGRMALLPANGSRAERGKAVIPDRPVAQLIEWGEIRPVTYNCGNCGPRVSPWCGSCYPCDPMGVRLVTPEASATALVEPTVSLAAKAVEAAESLRSDDLSKVLTVAPVGKMLLDRDGARWEVLSVDQWWVRVRLTGTSIQERHGLRVFARMLTGGAYVPVVPARIKTPDSVNAARTRELNGAVTRSRLPRKVKKSLKGARARVRG